MVFTCGIIGLPNVGKSTLFNSLTNSFVAAKNYPFCTIEPNTGICKIRDKRLYTLAQILKQPIVMPTIIKFIDIAGLVKGSSTGDGLGNKFLSHIRNTDAIAHVVRCFEDSQIMHMYGSINPKRDIEIVELEILCSDLTSCENQFEKLLLRKQTCPRHKDKINLLKTIINNLYKGKSAYSLFKNLSYTEKKLINEFNLISSKPVMYIANIDEHGVNNKYMTAIKDIAENTNTILVSLFCKKEHNDVNLNNIINSIYTLLNLHTYFTVVRNKVRACPIEIGTNAREASGVIHTDFKKGFIRAEVISYNDFIKYNGEQGAKKMGKVRLEGKTYIVKDGDVINFRFNI